MSQRIIVSAPGRICLFGEHQDYLLLPVIPCAISKRITVAGKRCSDRTVTISLPDIEGEESFELKGELPYLKERDYFRSAVNVVRRNGMVLDGGCECVVRGTIPINSGTSSSSALVVAWIQFLTQLSDGNAALPPETVARFAHQAEVVEFKEPGGQMDHYASALGGILYLDFFPKLHFTQLGTDLAPFVLGDSLEPKDTKNILSRVKDRMIGITEHLRTVVPDFSLRTTTVEQLSDYDAYLNVEQRHLLRGTVENFQITERAKCVLAAKPLDHIKVGELLNEHQAILRDVLRISTPKIDRMIEAALEAGAYGAKINGSGGGGCMFAYAPRHAEQVREAVEKAGGKAYAIEADCGVRIENDEVA